MGQEQKKYHVADNGDIFKINEDGSFTAIGNASQVDSKNPEANSNATHTQSSASKRWLLSNYNWLYLLSLTMLIVSGMLCFWGGTGTRSEGAIICMLSLCTGITAIVLPWAFKTISGFWVVILFLLMILAFILIIASSYDYLYTTQIALGFISLMSFGIAYAKNNNQRKK